MRCRPAMAPRPQFNIRELGGMGQWSGGGMTQVGDMFNDGLKQKVAALCQDLATLLKSRTVFDEGSASPRSYAGWQCPAWRRSLVAGGAGHAVLHRRAERHGLCPVSRPRARGGAAGAGRAGVRQRRSPHHRLCPGRRAAARRACGSTASTAASGWRTSSRSDRQAGGGELGEGTGAVVVRLLFRE